MEEKDRTINLLLVVSRSLLLYPIDCTLCCDSLYHLLLQVSLASSSFRGFNSSVLRDLRIVSTSGENRIRGTRVGSRGRALSREVYEISGNRDWGRER